MSASMGLRVTLFIICLTCVACDDGGAGRECAAGTQAVDGECVLADVSGDARCGAGTQLDPTTGQCVPDADALVCGPGTMLLGGECVLEETPVSCAPGTSLVDGQCTPSDGACAPGTLLDATGVCVLDTDVVCGSGTRNEDGVCVPDTSQVCEAGTHWDATAGACLADLTCRADQVAHEGFCLSQAEIDASLVSHTETEPDDNDAASGGTPESLPLPQVGESVFFGGTIDTPIDRDGDGAPDQDIDGWSFTASAGDVVKVVARPLGELPVGFRVVGPEGYVRHSPVYVTSSPSRDLWLPHDGEYRIEVAPQPYLDGAAVGPVGDVQMHYVGGLERVAPLVAQDLQHEMSASGALADLRDNFFRVRAPAEALLELGVDGPDAAFEPVLVVLDGAGRYLYEVTADEGADALTAIHNLYVEDDLHVLVDYVRYAGADDHFTVWASTAPHADLGTLGTNTFTLSGAAAVAPGESAWAAVRVAPDQVLTLTSGDADDQLVLTVLTPTGERVTREHRLSLYAENGGRYVVEVTHPWTFGWSIVVHARSTTPVDLGGFDLAGQTSDQRVLPASEADRSTFFKAKTNEAMQLGFVLTGSGAHQHTLSLVERLEARVASAVDVSSTSTRRLDVYPRAPELVIVDLYARVWTPAGLTLDVSAAPLPGLETEPNDQSMQAEALALDAEDVHGWLEGTADVDIWRVSLPTSLGSEELLEVTFASDWLPARVGCELRDATGQTVLVSQPPLERGCILRVGALAAGDYLALVQVADEADLHYLARATTLSGVAEVEPNDPTAGPASPPGVRLYAGASPGDEDRFAFPLGAALAPGEVIEVTYDSAGLLAPPNGVWLRDAAENGLLFVRAGERRLMGDLDAGDYHFYALSPSSGAGHYWMSHRRLTLNAHTETTAGHDTLATAQPLALPAKVSGSISAAADDYYAVTLASDLASGETLVVQGAATTPGEYGIPTKRIELLDSAGNLLAYHFPHGAGVIEVAGLGAGTYYVRIRTIYSTESAYMLAVEVL